MDRNSSENMKDLQDEQETSWDAFKKKRMIPILQTIGNEGKEGTWMHLPVGKMNLTKANFPKTDFSEVPDYENLWNEFIGEFKFIQANTYRAFSETLLNLLYKYTSTVPSSTIDFPDVSLYDHLKTTAALAVCLYDFQQEEMNGQSSFLLIGADFSGIQSYIYQIVSKYAGKNLKGRSFYLRILSDAVVRFLLKELCLFQANVVYNSGGGFYILAPNTSFVREKLEKAVKKAFPPEFINRVDEQVFFNHLEREALEKIIDIELKGLKSRVKEAGFDLTVTASAKRFVAEAGYDPNYGARPLKRAIQRFIEDPVSERIITERMSGGRRTEGKLRVSLDKADSCKLQVHFIDHVE